MPSRYGDPLGKVVDQATLPSNDMEVKGVALQRAQKPAERSYRNSRVRHSRNR